MNPKSSTITNLLLGGILVATISSSLRPVTIVNPSHYGAPSQLCDCPTPVTPSVTVDLKPLVELQKAQLEHMRAMNASSWEQAQSFVLALENGPFQNATSAIVTTYFNVAEMTRGLYCDTLVRGCSGGPCAYRHPSNEWEFDPQLRANFDFFCSTDFHKFQFAGVPEDN